MKFFQGFRFKRVQTPIHLLDPRTKLLISCSFFTAFLYSELLPLVTILLVQVPLVIIAHIQREWLQTLKGGAFFAVLIFVINVLTGSQVAYSLAMVLRFLILISAFSIFFLTTMPDDLGAALEKMGIPYDYCFMFTTAVRYVPVLATEASTIIDAQRSRGLEMEKGNFVKRVKNFIPVLIPLLVNSIRRSLEMAEAMEARCWGAVEQRTSLYVPILKPMDYAFIVVTVSAIILAIYLRLFWTIPLIEILIPLP
jgi:energy-coupling factor transport system permease protein